MRYSVVKTVGAAITVAAAIQFLQPTPPREPPGTVHPELWPQVKSPIPKDPALEARIDNLLAKMTIAEKVGQTLQAEMHGIKPEEVGWHHIGSVENGADSAPNKNKRSGPAEWAAAIDKYWETSVNKQNGVPIPIIWATDAVHGHSIAYGATVFPHNIGLGAARDAELMYRIGAATAAEIRTSGIDWSFSPTLAVVRDDRWGRTYESYSEDPKLVSEYASAIIRGLQGEGPTFLDQSHVIATAKHFIGDGGTEEGMDQGDNRASETELRDIHGAPYAAAIASGVQVIMISFSSWHDQKLHAHKSLITDVLKNRMGFDGIVIGDWDGHRQPPGCSVDDCPAAFNAGIDMFNVPYTWWPLSNNMIREVNEGVIPMERLDDAVRRILRVKLRAGVFDAPRPSARTHAGDSKLLGSAEHRALAREAVRKSLVLLKNDGQVLPVDPRKRILVAGDGADNLMKQTGGWTLTWLNNNNTNDDFPGATSIWNGIKAHVEVSGGTATLSPDGRYDVRPDVAIVVFGEDPYSEHKGDQPDLKLRKGSPGSLALLQRLKAEGIPVISVLLSGRPLYLNAHLNSSDAFVAAWLPGSEGAGIADVLLADATGAPRYDFTGKLSFSWPKRPDQTPLNVGDPNYDPQFAYGYGLNYATPTHVGILPEAEIPIRTAERGVFLKDGESVNGFSLSIGKTDAPRIIAVADRVATYYSESLILRRLKQGVRSAIWSGIEPAWLEVLSEPSAPLPSELQNNMSLAIRLRVVNPPLGPVKLGFGSGELVMREISALLAAGAGNWQTLRVPLHCFGPSVDYLYMAMRLETSHKLALEFSDVFLSETQPGESCPPVFTIGPPFP
jgi:beta-glucosidase